MRPFIAPFLYSFIAKTENVLMLNGVWKSLINDEYHMNDWIKDKNSIIARDIDIPWHVLFGCLRLHADNADNICTETNTANDGSKTVEHFHCRLHVNIHETVDKIKNQLNKHRLPEMSLSTFYFVDSRDRLLYYVYLESIIFTNITLCSGWKKEFLHELIHCNSWRCSLEAPESIKISFQQQRCPCFSIDGTKRQCFGE